ncbi:MAG: hypothetical protein CL484_10265 [Acidobacteria bacterium]|nr:hypothetical protein [Acidobacteriota bacterium]
MPRSFTRIAKTLLPVLVLGLASFGAYTMYLNRPPVETQPPVVIPPSVRVQQVSFETVQLTVSSQGTVQPRTTSQLVPEISGPIIEVSSSFAVGGFFEAGDILLKIDPYDYQQAVITGRSQLAQAQLRLAQEEAEAEVAQREWEEVGRGNPSALTLRKPQVADAQAAVAAAQSALDRAIRDLERAEILAPYAGRLQSKEVDVGQFVNKGNPVGRIYAVDSAEIRLPLPDDELAYVDVPMSYRGTQQQSGPSVTLSADFAGRRHSWKGRIARTESEIDAVSRMVHVVAEVDDPYAPGNDPNRPPLAAGMFVEAEIEGRTIEDVVVLPWAALRGQNQVLVVDQEDRLRFRQVGVLRSTRDEILVQTGLLEGERVCISALDTVTEGMSVLVLEDTADLQDDPTSAPPTTLETRSTRSTNSPPIQGNRATGRDLTPFESAPTRDQGAIPGSLTARPRPDETRPATKFRVDPSLSRPAQIAAIRREIMRLRNISPEATAAPPPSPLPGQNVSTEPSGKLRPVEPRNSNTQEPRASDLGTGRNSDSKSSTSLAQMTPSSVESSPFVPSPRPSSTPSEPKPVPITDFALSAVDPPASESPDLMVAVVPFTNLSGNPADDFIGEEMAATLQFTLDQQVGVHVSTLPMTDEADALAVADSEQVQWIIRGGYQRLGNQLRVTVRVFNVKQRSLFDSLKLDGTVSQHSTLTRRLVTAIHSKLSEHSAVNLATTHKQPTIAVATFTNISSNPGNDQIQTAVSEAIASDLRLPGVSIVRLGPGDPNTSLAENAAWLINGGYQLVGDQLRLTARLVEVSSGHSLKSIKIDGALDELSHVVDELIATLRPAIESSAANLTPQMALRTANTGL